MFMMPGGMDFSVRVGGTLQSLHLHLRRAVLEEVAGDLVAGDAKHLEILPRFGDSDPLIERLMLGVRDVRHDDDPATGVDDVGLRDYRSLNARDWRADPFAPRRI